MNDHVIQSAQKQIQKVWGGFSDGEKYQSPKNESLQTSEPQNKNFTELD